MSFVRHSVLNSSKQNESIEVMVHKLYNLNDKETETIEIQC